MVVEGKGLITPKNPEIKHMLLKPIEKTHESLWTHAFFKAL